MVHPKTYGCSRALNVQNKSTLCTYVLRKVLRNYNFNQNSITLNWLLILKQMGLLVTSEKKTALHTNFYGCLRTCYFYIIPMKAWQLKILKTRTPGIWFGFFICLRTSKIRDSDTFGIIHSFCLSSGRFNLPTRTAELSTVLFHAGLQFILYWRKYSGTGHGWVRS